MGRTSLPKEERKRRQRERAKWRRQQIRQSNQAQHIHNITSDPNIRLLASHGRNSSSRLHNSVPLTSETTDTSTILPLPAQFHAPNHQGIGVPETANNKNQAWLAQDLSHLSLSPIIYSPPTANTSSTTTIDTTAEIQPGITAVPLSPSPPPSQPMLSFIPLDEHLSQGQSRTDDQSNEMFEESYAPISTSPQPQYRPSEVLSDGNNIEYGITSPVQYSSPYHYNTSASDPSDRNLPSAIGPGPSPSLRSLSPFGSTAQPSPSPPRLITHGFLQAAEDQNLPGGTDFLQSLGNVYDQIFRAFFKCECNCK